MLMLLDISRAHPLTACTSRLRDHQWISLQVSCSKQCMDCDMEEHHSTERCLMQ